MKGWFEKGIVRKSFVLLEREYVTCVTFLNSSMGIRKETEKLGFHRFWIM